jgi:hypothetical protein
MIQAVDIKVFFGLLGYAAAVLVLWLLLRCAIREINRKKGR